MLQRTVSYESLFRVAGWCFLLYGIYVILLALTSQITVVGDGQYTGPMIFFDPIAVRNYIFCGGVFMANPLLPPGSLLSLFGSLTPGPLLWVSLGMLCLSA